MINKEVLHQEQKKDLISKGLGTYRRWNRFEQRVEGTIGVGAAGSAIIFPGIAAIAWPLAVVMGGMVAVNEVQVRAGDWIEKKREEGRVGKQMRDMQQGKQYVLSTA